MNHARTAVSRRAIALAALGMTLPVAADIASDEREIRELIATYATTVDRADSSMAERIFSNAAEVSFIHPRGEDRGREQIVTDIIKERMGGAFSVRKLTPKGIVVHVYGDTAWAEFSWDFVATVRKDGSAFHSQGVETQIYRREKGRWRIVHVHYSGGAVSGSLKGL
jgi:ketosteroid isomerase-like protein